MARFYKYFIFFFSLTILSAHPTFTKYSISTSANTAYSVYAVDGDGEMVMVRWMCSLHLIKMTR